MNPEWYYLMNGRQVGPVSTDWLRSSIASGSVLPHMNVWREGMLEWKAANAVPEFVFEPAAPMTPLARPAYASAAPVYPTSAAGHDASDQGNLIARAFNASGRFNRGEYAAVYLGSVALTWVLALIAGLDSSGPIVAVLLIWLAIQAVLVISAGVRRLHDLGQSGFLLLAAFVPLANVVMMFYLLLAPGRPAGSTQWG